MFTKFKSKISLLKPWFWGSMTFILLFTTSLIAFWHIPDQPIRQPLTLVVLLAIVWLTSFMVIAFLSRKPNRLQRSTLKRLSELEKKEKRNTAIINSLPDMVFIVDRDGRYIDYNISATQQKLVSPDNFLLKKISDFLSESLACETMSYIHQVLETGEAFTHSYQLEVDDRIRSYESRFVPHDKNDVMVLVRDTTDMKSKEQQILESECKYRTLVEQASDTIFIANLQGNFLVVNPAGCRMSQYAENELLKMRFHDLALADELVVRPFQLAEIASGKTIVSERKMRRKDGRVVDVEISARLIGPNRLLAFVRDVSERKRTEQELISSRENLRQLTNYIENVRETQRLTIAKEIHDHLGQQLAALKMNLSRLARKVSDDPSLQNPIDDLIEILNKMIDSVRKISLDLRPGMLDDIGLTATLEWYCEDFARRNGIDTCFDADIFQEEISQDVTVNLFRIFQESMLNVVAHAEATRVAVSLKRHEQNLLMIIHDNGKGFEVPTRKSDKTLGIHFMMERALKLKGTYRITSIPGNGTIVEVEIPMLTLS